MTPQVIELMDFDKMTPQERRTQVARDVLMLLDQGRIVPTKGVWVKTFVSGLLDRLHPDRQLRTALCRVDKCKCCHVGALIFAALLRFNRLTKGQAGANVTNEGLFFGGAVKEHITEFFNEKDIAMMEYLFERGDGAYQRGKLYDLDVTSEEIDRLDDAMRKIESSSTDRMRWICENLIRNGGEFKP